MTTFTSAFVTREEQRRVRSAEAERVVERVLDAALATGERDVVELALGILILEVDRRRDLSFGDRHRADRALHRTGRAEQVAHHRLRRADPELLVERMRAEHG